MDVYDFSVKRGSSWSGLSIQFTINNEPVDLTNAAIYMQVKKQKCVSEFVKQFSVGDGITITDASEGKFQIDPYIFDITSIVYYYDVRVEHNNRVDYIVGGELEVTQNVTRL